MQLHKTVQYKTFVRFNFTAPVFAPNVLIQATEQCRAFIADVHVESLTCFNDGTRFYRAYIRDRQVWISGTATSPLPDDKLHLAEWKLATGETIPLDCRQWAVYGDRMVEADGSPVELTVLQAEALIYAWFADKHYGEPVHAGDSRDADYQALIKMGLIWAGKYQGQPCYSLSDVGRAYIQARLD